MEHEQTGGRARELAGARVNRRRLLELAGVSAAGAAGLGALPRPAEARPALARRIAAAVSIDVDFADRREASTTRNFVAFQGGPFWLCPSSTWNDPAWERYLLPAWREIKPLPPTYWLFFDGDIGTSPGEIRVSRGPGGGGPNGDLHLDFTNFDAFIAFFKTTLQTPEAPWKGEDWNFVVGAIPAVMSSLPPDDPAWWTSMGTYEDFPAEWAYIVGKAVERIKGTHGIVGARYLIGHEFVTYILFRGRNRAEDERTLIKEDYLDYLDYSYYPIKAADRKALISAPGSPFTERLNGQWAPETLIADIAAGNAVKRAAGKKPIKLESYDWQGYDWCDDHYFEPGVRYIGDLMAQYPEDFGRGLPQLQTGYSPEYVCAPAEGAFEVCGHGDTFPEPEVHPAPLHWKASHLISNAARELTRHHGEGPDAPRVILAQWYDFNTNDPDPNGRDHHLSAVSSSFPGDCFPPMPDCRRPLYAAFQVLDRMADGKFVRATTSNPAVDVLAVRKAHDMLMVALSNNTASDDATTTFRLRSLHGWKRAARRLQRIDEIHSNECNGLEDGVTSVIDVVRGELTIADYVVPARSVHVFTFTRAR